MNDHPRPIAYRDLTDGTRLTTPTGRTYVVLFDPHGWPWATYPLAPGGQWSHDTQPLGPHWPTLDRLLDPLPAGDYPTWDELTRTCCPAHARGRVTETVSPDT